MTQNTNTHEAEYDIGQEIHNTLTGNGVDEYGIDGPKIVASAIKGLDRDPEVILALDVNGNNNSGPLVYLNVHEMPEEHAAVVGTEFLDQPDSVYVGYISDVAESIAELLDRDYSWVVRGDEDSLDAIKSYQ